jgi:hypothetical protein
MMQTQIPSGLQALMQASQVLSSQASPTAPGPQGPQPTVAERVNQQIKQVAQPQPPQGGIAGLTPNMQEIGKQAGVAGQIMAQRQAQQQQQAQNPQAVAQMAAQMLQSKGVAGLPSNMGFKEGGIIGFDGEDGSAVPAPNVPGMDKLMEIMKNAEGTEIASTDNQAALQALAEAQKRLAAATASQDARAVQIYAKQVADIRREIQSEPSTTPGEVVAPPMAPPRGLADDDELGRNVRDKVERTVNSVGRALFPGLSIASALEKTPAMQNVLSAISSTVTPSNKTEVSASDTQAAMEVLKNFSPDQIQRKLAEAVRNKDVKNAEVYSEALQLQKGEVPKPAPEPPRAVVQSGLRSPVKAAEPQSAPSLQQQGARVEVDPTKLEGYGVAAAGRAARPAVVPNERPRQAATGIPSALPARPATPPVKAGIPTVTIPETKINTSGIAEPTMKGALEGARQIVTGNADQTIKDLKAIRDEREKIKAGMTDLNAEEIKALEEDRAARRQLAASKAERDQFNRVQSFFRDLYTRGDSYGNVQAGIFARDEAERLAEKEHKKAVILLKKAQQAEKLGDLDRKAQYLKEYQDIKDKETTLLTQAAQISARIDESKYGKKMDAASNQAQIDSANVRTAAEINQRNQALQANLDIERQKVAGMSEERRNSRQGQALTAALGRLNDATQNLTKVRDQNKTNLAMKDSKDPTAQAMYQQADRSISTAETTYQEAKRVFDSIAAEALKGYATTPAKPAGGAKPDFIWDQKTQKMVPNK